jgi:hypothetical protein
MGWDVVRYIGVNMRFLSLWSRGRGGQGNMGKGEG